MNNKISYVKYSLLKNICVKLFESVGVPYKEAHICVDNLIDADLSGISSHGVSRMGIYLKRIREGVVNPKSNINVVMDSLVLANINGNNGMGQVISKEAMNLAIEKAKYSGVSLVTVNNSNHFGTAAYYAKMAIEHDMIGFVATNSPARMGPWGSSEPYFGTNPFSVTIPSEFKYPIIIDMATSVVARGKIISAEKEGENIPIGWALNSKGQNTTNATDALNGVVLPFGGPKGSALALLVDVLSGVLSGASFGKGINDMYNNFDNPMNVGHIFGAINVKYFIEIGKFKRQIDQIIADIKSSSLAEGFEEVFLPGEIELMNKELNSKHGVPVSNNVLKELKKEALKCNVEFAI